MKRTSFCIECGCDTPYSLAYNRVNVTVRGIKFSYVETTALCDRCGEEIYVPEVNDLNHDERENAYREAACLISRSGIMEILDKYCIGAGPLAKLLGFGDITINRYVNGQLPSKNHSEILLKVRHDRKYMEKILESGKDLIAKSAYDKCRKKIDELNQLYNNNKIDLITRYFINIVGDITALTLQKLLYYAQAFYYAIYNEVLFTDDCQAWVHGPVFPEIYHKYKEYGYNPINNMIEESEDNFDLLTSRERNFLDAIISSFGCYSGILLREMTHNEKPWIEARGNLHPSDKSAIVIDRNVINEYFSSVIKTHSIVNPCDISNYSKDMYEKLS